MWPKDRGLLEMGKSSENWCRRAVGLYVCGVLRGEDTIGKSKLVYGEKTTE